MNKRIKFLFIVGIIVFIIVIFAINILIKRYEKEPLPSISQDTEESVSKEEIPIKDKEQEELEFPEEEPPITKTEPLLN